jgi:hypothetical protein
MLSDGDITFSGFRAEMLRRMCDEDFDEQDLPRYNAVLQASAVGRQSEGRTEVAGTAGMPKVGPIEKIYDAVVRWTQADAKHLVPSGGERLLKVDPAGRTFYELKSGAEEIHDLPTIMLVFERFRHIMVGIGEGTEHSMHAMVQWHMQRLTFGESLAVVSLTFRHLLRLYDGADAPDWLELLDVHAPRVVSDCRALLGADIFRSELAQQEKEKDAVAQNAPGAAKERPCQRWNREDPKNRGHSLSCMYHGKDGQCTYGHFCSRCSGSEPAWKCGCQ